MSEFVERATDEEIALAIRANGDRPRRTLYVDEAETARSNPGVWFKMHIVGVPGPRMRAYQIRIGALTAFTPKGAFEAYPQGRDRVLFRCVPNEPEST
jgi:hypothetical protein